MVLDKLGDSLKSTLKKIAGSLFVDEKLIDELVKDIQRSLLQADVNVQLVFNLSKSIKKRALEEKPPKAISPKEHLINIVYEELVKFLGKEKAEIKIEKKEPFKIMMVGLFGSGKCVHPESNIILDNGEIIKAESFYNSYKHYGEELIDEGKIIDVSDKNISVPSFNPKTLKIENKKVLYLWKLEGKQLLKIDLDNGNDFSVKVTPEHPFFVLRQGKLEQIRADELNGDDFVAVPRSYKIKGEMIDLYPTLKALDLWFHGDKTLKEKILSEYLTLKEANSKLKYSNNYCKFTSSIKKGIAPLSLIGNRQEPLLKLGVKGAKKPIFFPRYLTNELAEFLGYVMGDGYIYKRYVEISNEDAEIINRVCVLSKILFGIEPELKKDERTNSMYKIRIVSTTLVKIFKIFGLTSGKKGKQLQVPKQIMKSQEDTIRLFLKAYFDCDSSLAKNTREIELSSESKPVISQIQSLLLRFGIMSTISKKVINNISYWRLSIRARYAELYSEKIGFKIKRKQKRADIYKKIGLKQGCGKQDMIPLANTMKELRQSLGFSIGKIQDYVNSYGRYENFGMVSRESLEKLTCLYERDEEGRMLNILKDIQNENKQKRYSQAVLNAVTSYFVMEGLISKEHILTQEGLQFLNQVDSYPKQAMLFFAKNLADSDVCWLRVNEVTKCNNEEGYVYDLTVEDNHSFIADNIIVHNTTSIGKLAKYYAKRGYKIAALGLDVHRPAAPEQLKQVSDQANIPSYIEKKEKDPIKIYKKYKKEFSKYDILIIDTAGRDALSKDLIEEIELLNETIKPEERLLVISADIGQAAQKQAEQFHKSCDITGVIVTKMDGTAKGGGALSACAVTKAPIKFIGVGEKIDDMEEFNPKGFVGRLLGMGDIEALLAKAKEAITEEDAKDLGKKFLKGEYNFLDLYEQIQAVKKMGPLNKIMDLIPGAGSLNIPKDILNVQDEKLKKWKFIFQSCTKEELENPDIITRERVDRISKGSGIPTSEIRELLRMHKQSKKLMRMMGGITGKEGEEQDINKLMRKFKGKMPKGLGKLKGMKKMKF